MLYYRCISAAIEPDRIGLLLLNILSLAGKHQQKTNNLRSWQAKFLPSVWFKTETLRCLQRTSPIYASWNNDEKSMMQSLLSHPEHKENIQKPDAKSRNSPGQCLGITQDFRTTVDNVASHKVSHKRSWQCSLLLRWEWTDRHSPLDVCLLVLIKKKKSKEEHTVMQLIVDESQKLLAAAVPNRFASLCCRWFSSPRSRWRPQNWWHSWS